MSDRDLVMRWVRAWAHVRGLRVEQVDGWPLVHVRGPSRDTEIVCVDPGRAAFEQLAQHTAHDPREMLTVFGRDLADYLAPPLPPGLRVDRDDELFMTTTLDPSPCILPDGFAARWAVDGPRATYSIDDGSTDRRRGNRRRARRRRRVRRRRDVTRTSPAWPGPSRDERADHMGRRPRSDDRPAGRLRRRGRALHGARLGTDVVDVVAHGRRRLTSAASRAGRTSSP